MKMQGNARLAMFMKSFGASGSVALVRISTTE